MNIHESAEKSGRILVAFDSLPAGEAFLQVAIRLAAELQAELHGLFIEDANLLRGSALPHAHELGIWLEGRRPISVEAMERSLRTAATMARRALSQAAIAANLPWSFATVRGALREAMNADLEQADIVLTSAGRLAAVPIPTMGSGPMIVFFDGSPASIRALQAATHLQRRAGDYLLVAVMPPASPELLRRQWLELDLAATQQLHILSSPLASVADCLPLAQKLKPALFFLSINSPFSQEPTFSQLRRSVGCPIALVR